ncbi:hypothetical protein HDC92_000609 [Pedobacter sp. AK017]|uniref:hypothetical protein n=1 Tax=Pedobacter sp. AK017 TaxID=2723073 RepID=UPI00161FB086|nr:hypothetical protein [Pedobacter sp. AK017]MBB5436945.1 hypothetical protein [Pedobacter sp. AK017]
MDEEILQKLDTVLARQEELKTMMLALSHNPLILEQAEVWFTKEKVLDELCIAPRTFYRRRKTENWKTKRSGGTVYYLKSSLRK